MQTGVVHTLRHRYAKCGVTERTQPLRVLCDSFVYDDIDRALPER